MDYKLRRERRVRATCRAFAIVVPTYLLLLWLAQVNNYAFIAFIVLLACYIEYDIYRSRKELERKLPLYMPQVV